MPTTALIEPLKGHSFSHLPCAHPGAPPPAQISGRSLVPPEEKLLSQMLEAVTQRLAPPVLVQQSSTLYSRMGPLAMFERWGQWPLQSATLSGSATPSNAPRTPATALTSRAEGAVAAVAGALAAASGALAAAAARVVEKTSFDLHETQLSAPSSARSPAALGTSAHPGAPGMGAHHGALGTSARSRLAASASKAPFDGVTSALSSCILNGPWAYSPEADNLRWALRYADRDAECILSAS